MVFLRCVFALAFALLFCTNILFDMRCLKTCTVQHIIFDRQPKIETAPTTAEDEEKAKIVPIPYIKGTL